MEVREDDEDFQNPVDLMFEDLKKKNPDHFAVRQYAKFKLAAGKTLKSILVSAGARLAPFDIQEVREITMYDELELDTLGDEKTALFLMMSDTDGSFNFLISMIYTQLFNLLCEKADDVYGGRLPVHVRCLIDEAANIAKNKDLYYDALNRAQHGWHEGTEDAVPFIKYLLGTILAAYKDFGDRFAIVEEKLPAIDMVRKAAQNKIGRFTKQDIREQCPSLSLSSVESALRKMVASGELKREGAGKSTCYVRLK